MPLEVGRGGPHLLPACKKKCCSKKSKVHRAWQSWCERSRDEFKRVDNKSGGERAEVQADKRPASFYGQAPRGAS